MIHLRPVREAIEKARIETTSRLRDEIEEARISRLQSEGKIARHFKASQQFKQTAEAEWMG
jgi:hypothetical protein